MKVNTRIETLSPDGLLDVETSVHVRDLLATCEQPSDAWVGCEWNLEAMDGGEVELPEPNSPAALEVPWASDCWGRILCHREGWNNSEWSIEEAGVLISPIYEEDMLRLTPEDEKDYQVHLVKATRSGVPSRRDLWLWTAELKVHCHMMRTLHGVLHVYYAGNPDSGPVAMRYEMAFTGIETHRMWKLVTDLRKVYRIPRATRKPPGEVTQ
jgi:hypothetical protein